MYKLIFLLERKHRSLVHIIPYWYDIRLETFFIFFNSLIFENSTIYKFHVPTYNSSVISTPYIWEYRKFSYQIKSCYSDTMKYFALKSLFSFGIWFVIQYLVTPLRAKFAIFLITSCLMTIPQFFYKYIGTHFSRCNSLTVYVLSYPPFKSRNTDHHHYMMRGCNTFIVCGKMGSWTDILSSSVRVAVLIFDHKTLSISLISERKTAVKALLSSTYILHTCLLMFLRLFLIYEFLFTHFDMIIICMFFSSVRLTVPSVIQFCFLSLF